MADKEKDRAIIDDLFLQLRQRLAAYQRTHSELFPGLMDGDPNVPPREATGD